MLPVMGQIIGEKADIFIAWRYPEREKEREIEEPSLVMFLTKVIDESDSGLIAWLHAVPLGRVEKQQGFRLTDGPWTYCVVACGATGTGWEATRVSVDGWTMDLLPGFMRLHWDWLRNSKD